MLVSVFFALFLPCVGMGTVFVVYLCILWYAATRNAIEMGFPGKPIPGKGLSASELEKLPKASGNELMGMECSVCLDEIEAHQAVRLIPGCNHGFHLECADKWLSKNRICPVCRAILEGEILNPVSGDNPC